MDETTRLKCLRKSIKNPAESSHAVLQWKLRLIRCLRDNGRPLTQLENKHFA